MVPKPKVIVHEIVVSLMTTTANYFLCTAGEKFPEGFHNIRVTAVLETIYCNRVVKPLTQSRIFRANMLAKNFAHNKAFTKIRLL
jgi:hypothetical protein